MKELFAEVPTPAGKMRAFVTYPEQDGPFPAVVIYMDFWGIREELYNVARWLGAVGFYCVVPDLYYRQGTVVNEIHDEHGKMVSLDRLDQATHDKVLAPLRNLTDTEAMDDTQSLLSFLDGQDMVRPGQKAASAFALAAVSLCALRAVFQSSSKHRRACTAHRWSPTAKILPIAQSITYRANSTAASPSTIPIPPRTLWTRS